MKINAINSTVYNNKAQNFGHTAVPYPEYEQAYYYNKQQTQNQTFSKIIDKISALFTPEVTQKSQEIKTSIDQIYAGKKQAPVFNGNPKKQLLSVLA